MFTKILYGLAVALLTLSYFKNKKKTFVALKKALKSFEKMLPQMLIIIFIIGLTLSWLSPQVISSIIGGETGILGMIISSIIGSITLMPAFVAFPLASALLENGAGLVQIAVFVSTLMMVGIVTIPMEKQIFGNKATLTRNILAFFFSFAIAGIMGRVLL